MSYEIFAKFANFFRNEFFLRTISRPFLSVGATKLSFAKTTAWKQQKMQNQRRKKKFSKAERLPNRTVLISRKNCKETGSVNVYNSFGWFAKLSIQHPETVTDLKSEARSRKNVHQSLRGRLYAGSLPIQSLAMFWR